MAIEDIPATTQVDTVSNWRDSIESQFNFINEEQRPRSLEEQHKLADMQLEQDLSHAQRIIQIFNETTLVLTPLLDTFDNPDWDSRKTPNLVITREMIEGLGSKALLDRYDAEAERIIEDEKSRKNESNKAKLIEENKETITSKFTIRRASPLTTPLATVNGVVGSNQLDFEHPYFNVAKETVGGEEELVNLKVAEVRDKKRKIPLDNAFQLFTRELFPEEHYEIASRLFDLRAIIAGRKAEGVKYSEISAAPDYVLMKDNEVRLAFEYMFFTSDILVQFINSQGNVDLVDRDALAALRNKAQKLLDTPIDGSDLPDLEKEKLLIFLGEKAYESFQQEQAESGITA